MALTDKKGNLLNKDQSHKIKQGTINIAFEAIFLKWVRGVCDDCHISTVAVGGKAEGSCSLCKNKTQQSMIKGTCDAKEGCAESWANITWANNAVIGVGTTIIHCSYGLFLLLVINYQDPPDASSIIEWKNNIPFVCAAHSGRWTSTLPGHNRYSVCEGSAGKSKCLTAGNTTSDGCMMPQDNTSIQI